MPLSFQVQDNVIAEKFPSTLGSGQISGIPDASAIHAAKKRREMLRQKSAFLDYIPLDDNTDVDSISEKKIESRLVREDDEIGDADEVITVYNFNLILELGQYVEEKVPLGKKAEREHQRLKKAGIKEMLMEVDYEDEDDEIMQWEMEQIKKGGHSLKTSANQPQSKKPAVNISSKYKDKFLKSELVQIQKDIEGLVKSSEQIENELQTTKKRYTYFQELKTFVENLVEFLDDKFPTLEKLESDIDAMLKERTERIMKRIMEDDSDDLVLFSNDYQNELGRVKPPASVSFSVSDTTRQRRRQQRDKRRSKRLQRDMEDEVKMEEGLSTDDELGEADDRDMATKIDEISYHKTKLFEDVIDDFKSIYLVKSKFDTWKKEFSEDYAKAYGDLSLPGVFEFYVRYEILLWETFKGHSDFGQMEWYQTISGSNDMNSSSDISENDKLLTKIVEKVIIPRAIHLVKVLNPYSSEETKSAIEFCKSMLKFVDKNSPKFKDFTSAISSCLQNIVLDIKHPDTFSLRKSEMDENALRSRDRFFWRRYKLMKNLILWKDYIQEDFVRPLVTENLIDQCMLRILNVSPANAIKFQKILEIVPGDWFSPPTLEKIARGAVGI
ncbi:9433_t:CDS:10 [Racocetra fulgida]|uniref:9433_t:CDS:1 n=2 Tax=Racocetra TaxID=940663 RepID=A0A9N8YYG3_9GLOM|nr:9433_t:CDS:10 [Racocetra fulgida]